MSKSCLASSRRGIIGSGASLMYSSASPVPSPLPPPPVGASQPGQRQCGLLRMRLREAGELGGAGAQALPRRACQDLKLVGTERMSVSSVAECLPPAVAVHGQIRRPLLALDLPVAVAV
ncbi:hypothetical protein EJB05_28334 [Eragrostis curvula]|uniref:Uncharacterized protein n=1 Tax=Eragrostis curvula TaxID=38414 RepID=A0A5J9UL20_9POAL|nr:hypothetical protein EJB05_26373 [Eragrostis curvula]TVU24253.1 hypothetical protein EJB05_26674 [Eragrostis curvula]TVU25824.1 hypothetical protein EJB05_28334 [Eragrostis curvula]